MILQPPDLCRAPALAGSYLLVFYLDAPLAGVAVGRLGRQCFLAGSWIYCGSAWGPGGLRARLARHLAADKRPHWHLDYVAGRMIPQAVLYCVQESGVRRRLECVWAQQLAAAGWTVPVPGFGSSDCRSGCPAHLLHRPDRVRAGDVERVLEHG